MAEETTRQFINRRKRELTFQIPASRGQLGSKEEELAELNRAEAALTVAGSAPTPRTERPSSRGHWWFRTSQQLQRASAEIS
jgi:hypothetical protein